MEGVIIGNATLYHADCIDAMKAMPSSSIDSVVCDPPYGLSFMGKGWDYDVPSVEVWSECLRVLKPGGHLLAFAGTRTQHRMAVRIEDACFEIRDMIAWVYGSGFPKSHNGDWGGTALKPSLEPITMARKPLVGTVEANWREHGTGALNIDGCRVEPTGESRERVGESTQDRRYTDNGNTTFSLTSGVRGGDPSGRWPANLIHDGSEEVLAAFPVTGKSTGGGKKNGDKFGGGYAPPGEDAIGYGDTGSAARFFYCAKASKRDRDEGLDGFVKTSGGMVSNTSGQHMTRRDDGYQVAPRANNHPTVKPTELMRYLCRLVTPPGGVVLDPFMGSGSTGKAAILEGFRFVGVELESEYFDIAHKRIENAQRMNDMSGFIAVAGVAMQHELI